MTVSVSSPSAGALGLRWPILSQVPRWAVVLITVAAVLLPLVMIGYQSLLNAPFFFKHQLSLDAYKFVFSDDDFYVALKNSLVIAGGMVVVSIPLGAILAFLMVRTDMPWRRWIEPMLLTPIFISAVVLALGYVVATGPTGFYTLWWRSMFGEEPWNVYSLTGIAVIAGLTHVPHVYLYASAALRNVGSDVEEAARISGASPFRVARDVSIPMIMPSMLFAAVLMLFLGFEVFGLPLVLGDPGGYLVLTTYMYKLANKLGIPSYHLMAVVAMVIVAVTFPLVIMQRRLLKSANKYVTLKGKGGRTQVLRLGRWRWLAIAIVMSWLFVTVFVPVSGIALRSFVTSWGEGVSLIDAMTLDNYREVFEQDNLVRAIVNTLGIGIVGGAAAVAWYTAIAFTAHRRSDAGTQLMDYLVLVPRAIPGLLAGLAFLWVFLFIPGLKELRGSMISIWIAYSVIWLAYGMRVVQGALMQVGPDLEEAARVAGATRTQTNRHITLPLVRFGLLSSWLLIFLIFEREYSTGVYLLSPGSEVIGALLVSMWASGATNLVAALSVINILMVSVGLALALRFGIKLHD